MQFSKVIISSSEINSFFLCVSQIGIAPESVADEDEDVRAERERVYRKEYPADAPVICHDLHKSFDLSSWKE